ncbi:hypothetical protein E2C01_092388 [Portunus trituberculatus]|uniref:Uncharacterized protein n=1 Tax=Portunus trituberculatus TaxID=210409 RepID=A0A5B7JRW6_PORTR|nr:hypothetical protein [Portunus trituberculatus]
MIPGRISPLLCIQHIHRDGSDMETVIIPGKISIIPPTTNRGFSTDYERLQT